MPDIFTQNTSEVILVIYIVGQLLTGWWRNRRTAERNQVAADRATTEADRVKNEALAIQTQALNTALASLTVQQGRIDRLEDEKITANRQRIDLENTIDGLRDSITQMREDNQKVVLQLGQQLTKVKADLAQAQAEIQRLTAEATQKDSRIEQLKLRVDTLEREGREKDRKIAGLKASLEVAEADKERLAQELRDLRAQVNGQHGHTPGEAAGTPPYPDSQQPERKTEREPQS